jgi:ectoine hydroxylase
MRLGLTDEERADFEENGFIILKNALSKQEVTKITDVVDKLYERFGGEAESGRLEMHNCLAQHPLLLQLIENANVLPIVIDLLGPNIKIRSSNLDVRPPLRRDSVKNELGRERLGGPGLWHVDGPLYGYPTVGGILPMMEVKVGYYLTDTTHPESGALCVVPGSHRLDYQLLADASFRVPAEDIFKVQVLAGSAVIFRTGLWHCVSPNFSYRTRKVLYYAYTFRWIEPSDYIQQSEKLLSRCNLIQRQLLGATTSPKRNPLGNEPSRNPCSFYWYSELEDIPLTSWLETLRDKRHNLDTSL